MEKKHIPEKIDGDRIYLKRFDVDLGPLMFAYVDEDRERLSKFLPWPQFIKTVEDEIEFIKQVRAEWDAYDKMAMGIFRKSDNEYMGNLSAFQLDWNHHSLEMGYWILGKFEGKGYMSEAVLLFEKAFRHIGFNRMVIRCDPNNKRSASIPQRNSYKLEGIQREVKFYYNGYHDLEVYSKVNSDL